MTDRRATTPMMAQYLGIKAQHPDKIVLFRMGDFYETFYDDAIEVSDLLGITLTAREKKGDQPIPLAGVPHHALDHYLVKLLAAGRTVAICEQMEDPAKVKGLVKRDVVEVMSPGTVTNPSLLGSEASHYLLCIVPIVGGEWGYALLDGSTGEFRCGESDPEEVLGRAARSDVREVLIPELPPPGLSDEAWPPNLNGVAVTPISNVLLEPEYASRCLQDHFGVRDLTGLGLADLPAATAAAGAALRTLEENQRTQATQVQALQVERADDTLYLDRETAAHLELFDPLRPGDNPTTLIHHLQATRTPMGRRRLARWLRAPLANRAAIEVRQDAVQWLVEQPREREALQTALSGVGDLERIAGRIATGRVMPHELGALRDGLERLPEATFALADVKSTLLKGVHALAPVGASLASKLRDQLVESLPTHLRKGGIFRDGVDRRLDELLALSRGGKTWIAEHQAAERERTGIPSLKVGYNKVFGYYLEVTNAHRGKVPEDYQEKQTLTNARRFITADLKEKEREILGAEAARIEAETACFAKLVAELQGDLAQLRELLDVVAVVDTLAALAAVAIERGYSRPELVDEPGLSIEGGRHAVVERIVGEPFVPNDLELDPTRQLVLLTGPNMGGKSTYLRQAALIVVLAQMGSFVPATRARLGLVDRLFTRVGASDNLGRGQSTFLVEMSETAKILRNSTSRSLVILDEVGRGTSTDDGRSLAWAIAEYLHDGPARPLTIFATHFHELTDLAERLPRARNLQMKVHETDGRILFLHRVVDGASDRSYGVHVAELAGVPREVLRRATELLREPAAMEAAAGANAAAPPPPQLPLFAGPHQEILDALADLDPDQLRPLDALQLLAEWRSRLDS